MQKKKFGNTDMQITRIGLGCWAMGGGNWASGWGSQDDNDSIAAIHEALEQGINWIDTAAIYGLGRSEEVVGRALKGRSEKPYVFTKCSLLWDENRKVYSSLQAASVRKEVEDSLRRLQVDVIDLYQIHWPNPADEIEEGWSTLAKLKEEGKVRHIGLSNFSVEQMQRMQAIAPISSLQPPYSMVKRDIEKEILPFCEEHNIGVIIYSPMRSGLLTGAITEERVKNMENDDWRKNDPEFNPPRLERNQRLVALLQEIGNEHGDASPGEVAIAWTLHHPAVTAAIVGARHPRQVKRNNGAADLQLSNRDIERIETFLHQNP